MAAVGAVVVLLTFGRRQHERAEMLRAELARLPSVGRSASTGNEHEGNPARTFPENLAPLRREAQVLRAVRFIAAVPAPSADGPATPAEISSVAAQEQRARGYRARMAARYAPFFLGRGLTPEQVDELEVVLTKHWNAREDLKAVAEAKHLDDDDTEIARLRREADDALRAEELALLGDEGLRALREYERTVPLRELVGEVTARLCYTDVPFDGLQAERFARILLERSAAYRAGGDASVEDVDWVGVRSDVAVGFPPAQVAAIHGKIAAIECQLEFNRGMERIAARMEPGAVGAGGGGSSITQGVEVDGTTKASIQRSF